MEGREEFEFTRETHTCINKTKITGSFVLTKDYNSAFLKATISGDLIFDPTKRFQLLS